MKALALGLLIVATSAAADDNRKLLCHATNLYFEARGEPLIGQLAVRDVVNNRGDDPCKVVFACKQFSWTESTHRSKVREFLSDQPRLLTPADQRAWELAKFIAGTPIRVLPEEYKHFYNPKKASPAWRAPGKKLGNHVFIPSVRFGNTKSTC